MNVFLDANVLFTAAYDPRGLCHGLFRLARAGRCRLLVSAFVVEEARRNLAVKAPDRLALLEPLLEHTALVGEPPPALVRRLESLPLDGKDAPVLAAAVAAGSDLLVTGDRRHFGHLYGLEVSGVRVLAPAEAVDLLLPG